MYIFQPERYLLRKQIEHYVSYLCGGVVLDVGAGQGDRYSELIKCDKYLRMDVEKYDGIDIVGRAEKIPLGDSSIDSVICTQVFEHLKYPQRSAQELHRILKSGGILLITAPQVNELHEEPNDFYRYTKFGLIELFESCGFKTVIYEQRGGFFTTIAQIRIRYLIDKFKLYKRPLIGRITGKFLAIYGKIMMWLDILDKSNANKKHTLGWCFIFKK